MILENEDLALAKLFEEVAPKLEKINQYLESGRISLKNQQFRLDQQHGTIVAQEKQITENKKLIEEANTKAKFIISIAEERAREVEKNIQIRSAEINHLEREAKRKAAEADKILWDASQKKSVKV